MGAQCCTEGKDCVNFNLTKKFTNQFNSNTTTYSTNSNYVCQPDIQEIDDIECITKILKKVGDSQSYETQNLIKAMEKIQKNVYNGDIAFYQWEHDCAMMWYDEACRLIEEIIERLYPDFQDVQEDESNLDESISDFEQIFLFTLTIIEQRRALSKKMMGDHQSAIQNMKKFIKIKPILKSEKIYSGCQAFLSKLCIDASLRSDAIVHAKISQDERTNLFSKTNFRMLSYFEESRFYSDLWANDVKSAQVHLVQMEYYTKILRQESENHPLYAKTKVMRAIMEMSEKLFEAAIIHLKEAMEIYENQKLTTTNIDNEIQRQAEVGELCDVESYFEETKIYYDTYISIYLCIQIASCYKQLDRVDEAVKYIDKARIQSENINPKYGDHVLRACKKIVDDRFI